MSQEMRTNSGRGEISNLVSVFPLQTSAYRQTHHILFTFVSGSHGNLLSILKRASQICVCVWLSGRG